MTTFVKINYFMRIAIRILSYSMGTGTIQYPSRSISLIFVHIKMCFIPVHIKQITYMSTKKLMFCFCYTLRNTLNLPIQFQR